MPRWIGLCAVGAFVVTAALPMVACAQPAAIVLQYGETVSDKLARVDAEEAGTGLTPAQTVRNVRFVGSSDQIEAALCRGFGVRIVVVLQPGQHYPAQLHVRVHHPMLTRPDGATSSESDFPASSAEGGSYAGFTFDYEWEMQPGEWEIAFYDGEERVAAKTFTVRAPEAGGPASVCEGAPTS